MQIEKTLPRSGLSFLYVHSRGKICPGCTGEIMSIGKSSAVSTTLVLAVLMALTACSKPPASKAPESATAVNAGGVDLAGMDRSVKPGDDFFSYANGTWIKSTEIPVDR